MAIEAHAASLRDLISEQSLLRADGFIGGEWVSSSKTFPVFDPATDNVIANIADLAVDDFKRAIDHASKEFDQFKKTTETHRSKLLHKVSTPALNNPLRSNVGFRSMPRSLGNTQMISV